MAIGSEILQKTLPLLLRPIVKFCLSHSIRFGELLEYLKRTFVDVAKEELIRRGDAVSASRLSVITGVHRKDTTHYLKHGFEIQEPKSVISKVLGLWQSNRAFTGVNGKPRVLEVEGKESEFSELVQAVSADLNPYTVLYELERIGAVERTRSGIKLVSRLYLPKGDVEGGLRLLGADAQDLYAAVQENINNVELPNLHIKTEYDNIPENFWGDIRKWLISEGSAFHQRARSFLSQFDRDAMLGKVQGIGRIRVAVGSFSISEKVQG